jgi:FkbM family methyltransferase
VLRLLAAILHRRPQLRPAASIAHRLGERSNGERVGRLRTGGRIVLDLADHAQRHTYLYGVVEEDTTGFVRDRVGAGDIVLDVGANSGYYSVLCADLGATVFAFEPQPRLAAAIRRSAALNGHPIEVHETAVGARAGEAMLLESTDPYYGGMATLVADYYTLSTPTHPVSVIALDDFCSARGIVPTLVKIDVEGFEAEVLEGMVGLMHAARPLIVCEVAFDRPHAERVSALVRAAGYEIELIGPRGLEPLPADAQVENVCFVPPGQRDGSR